MKTLKLITSLIAAASMAFGALAEDNKLSASIEGGYSTEYLVYGVSYAENAPFAGFNIGAEYFGVDFGVNGAALPSSSGLNQSVWGLGLGKTFSLSEPQKIAVRATGNVNRFLTGGSTIPDTTFADVGVALENPYLTPYVKGAYGIEVDQVGVIGGVKREFSVFGLFTATPAFEYGYFTDYEFYSAKIGVSRVLFGHLEVFAEGAYVDNTFSGPVGAFAIKQLNDDFIGTGGIRWRF